MRRLIVASLIGFSYFGGISAMEEENLGRNVPVDYRGQKLNCYRLFKRNIYPKTFQLDAVSTSMCKAIQQGDLRNIECSIKAEGSIISHEQTICETTNNWLYANDAVIIKEEAVLKRGTFSFESQSGYFVKKVDPKFEPQDLENTLNQLRMHQAFDDLPRLHSLVAAQQCEIWQRDIKLGEQSFLSEPFNMRFQEHR